METTYGMACPVCVWMIDNRPTTEHVEREYLAHVRAQHPDAVEQVVADALAGECRARFSFDSILTQPCVVHPHGSREGPERCQRRRLSAQHRLEERPGGRRPEAIH